MKKLFTVLVLSAYCASFAQVCNFVNPWGVYTDTTLNFIQHQLEETNSLDTIYAGQTVNFLFTKGVCSDNSELRYSVDDSRTIQQVGFVSDGVEKEVFFRGQKQIVYSIEITIPFDMEGESLVFFPGRRIIPVKIVNETLVSLPSVEKIKSVKKRYYYTLDGKAVGSDTKGLIVEHTYFNDGTVARKKMVNL